MNSLCTALPPTISYSVYVDDIQVSFRSCNLSICEWQIQLGVNRVSKWADENGFAVNVDKTVCVSFNKSKSAQPAPCIKINGSPICVKNEHKFLGLTFDSRMSFIPNIKALKLKCMKTMNLLKMLSHPSWGTDRKCLLSLFNSLVKSRLNYGCVVYQSASKTAVKMLDPVYHSGIRLATGAFRTSPVSSLYVEANEWPMQLEREYCSLMYTVKLFSIPTHPSAKLVADTSSLRFCEKRPSLSKPFNSALPVSRLLLKPKYR